MDRSRSSITARFSITLDVRPELERAGHTYVTHCDTETILHAYEEFGPKCLQRFRGMFSFALWDRTRRTLFCARDRLGIKPFYYFWDGTLFVFASEIKALLRAPCDFRQAERGALIPEYLAFGYTSERRHAFFRHPATYARPSSDIASAIAKPRLEIDAIGMFRNRLPSRKSAAKKSGSRNAAAGLKKPSKCG